MESEYSWNIEHDEMEVTVYFTVTQIMSSDPCSCCTQFCDTTWVITNINVTEAFEYSVSLNRKIRRQIMMRLREALNFNQPLCNKCRTTLMDRFTQS